MDKKTRILIVEDEFINMDLLRSYLENAGYEISGDAMNADEAMEVLERFDTDFAILDINIQGEKDGIWVAEQIRAHYHIPFIFLTAYSDKATVKRAAEVNPYSYLVKPFTQADIFTSIEIALKNYEKEQERIDLPEEFLHENTELHISDAIFVKDNTTYKRILIKEIQYAQSFKNYIEVFTKNGRMIMRSSLQNFLAVLPQKYFVQVHRSFVVNTDYIDLVESDFILIGEKKIPLSKSYKNDLFKKMHFWG